MVKRPLKLREKAAPEEESETAAAALPEAELAVETRVAETRKPEPEITGSQKRRAELGRYWLQVDRQTKRSFKTEEEAEAAGMVIKTKFAQVQVAIYDRDESRNRILELPAA
jgi:hypothetical protein